MIFDRRLDDCSVVFLSSIEACEDRRYIFFPACIAANELKWIPIGETRDVTALSEKYAKTLKVIESSTWGKASSISLSSRASQHRSYSPLLVYPHRPIILRMA